jgi:hypothetical protein
MLFARSAQLTCEGALRLLFSTSARDAWDRLVRAGLEWEDEYTPVSEHGGRQRGERGEPVPPTRLREGFGSN